jgi:hypothetical protein
LFPFRSGGYHYFFAAKPSLREIKKPKVLVTNAGERLCRLVFDDYDVLRTLSFLGKQPDSIELPSCPSHSFPFCSISSIPHFAACPCPTQARRELRQRTSCSSLACLPGNPCMLVFCSGSPVDLSVAAT